MIEQCWQSYEPASVHDILGDHVVYRNLQPMDQTLPGLCELRTPLGIDAAVTPRKATMEYARVIEHILKIAQPSGLQRMVYIGDTLLNDGSAFRNIADVSGWDAVALIVSEKRSNPAVLTWHPSQSKIQRLFTANRWSLTEQFRQVLTTQNFFIDEHTAVVIDLDKTTLGARGRNDRVIDDARLQAAYKTASEYFEDFDPLQFRMIYDKLNQPEYHPITADNQDFLVYICLLVVANCPSFDDLLTDIRNGQIQSFDDFEDRSDACDSQLSPLLTEMKKEFQTRLSAGDPTPFKHFRQNEYLNTVQALQFNAKMGDIEQLMKEKIVLTAEVKTFADHCKKLGAALFAISDKPDEASIPTPELSGQGYVPLHQIKTAVIGHASG